jgi:ribonuclease P protein component
VSGNTLSKNQRMIQASLFREAFAQKRSFVGRTMVLWLRSGDDAAFRLGVITSKKVSNRAVDRNLARRRLREIFRQHRSDLAGPFDLLIIARRNLLAASYAETEREFLWLAKKAGLLK